MEERLHRQLKASLMSHSAREHWVEKLPIVVLGIRSSLKPEVNSCVAELVYNQATWRVFITVLIDF